MTGSPIALAVAASKVHAYKSRPIWKCSGCNHQFSVTSGTIFDNRKRPVRDYLLAIALFTNGAKGISALQLSRDLNCQYKTAFVLAHKLRELIAAEQKSISLRRDRRDRRRIFCGPRKAEKQSRRSC